MHTYINNLTQLKTSSFFVWSRTKRVCLKHTHHTLLAVSVNAHMYQYVL